MNMFSHDKDRGACKLKSLSCLFFFLFSYCSTTVNIPIVKSYPQGFEESIGYGRNLGIFVSRSEDLRASATWKTLIQGEILNKFQDKRYFRIIDIANRESRLKELVFSQKIGATKTLSSEFSIDLLLLVDVPQPPSSECNTYSRRISKQRCVRFDNSGKCVQYKSDYYIEYTKELVYSFFVRAKLIHLETGQNLEYTNSEPVVLRRTSAAANLDCPSELEALNNAMELAADEITKRLSPTIVDVEIPIYKDDGGISKFEQKKTILSYLESGIDWLKGETPNIEYAKKDWEKAAALSGNSSLSALWNIGVYYWYKGDFSRAEEFFKKVREAGGKEGWLNSKRRNSINLFEKERSRSQASLPK